MADAETYCRETSGNKVRGCKATSPPLTFANVQGYLVSIKDEKIGEFLYNKFKKKAWIGAKRQSFRPTFNKPMQCERAAAVRTIHSNGNLVSSEKYEQNSMKTDFKIDVKISETLYSLDKGCKCPRVSSRLLQTPPTSLSDTTGDGLSPLV